MLRREGPQHRGSSLLGISFHSALRPWACLSMTSFVSIFLFVKSVSWVTHSLDPLQCSSSMHSTWYQIQNKTKTTKTKPTKQTKTSKPTNQSNTVLLQVLAAMQSHKDTAPPAFPDVCCLCERGRKLFYKLESGKKERDIYLSYGVNGRWGGGHEQHCTLCFCSSSRRRCYHCHPSPPSHSFPPGPSGLHLPRCTCPLALASLRFALVLSTLHTKNVSFL